MNNQEKSEKLALINRELVDIHYYYEFKRVDIVLDGSEFNVVIRMLNVVGLNIENYDVIDKKLLKIEWIDDTEIILLFENCTIQCTFDKMQLMSYCSHPTNEK